MATSIIGRCNGCLKLFSIVHRRMSSLPKYSVTETRKILMQHQGGSIDLNKDRSTGIATLTLNYPAKKNALTGKMMVELEEHISDLESWREGRGLILHGAGGTFCSGGDLDFVKKIFTSELGYFMANFMHSNLSRLSNLPMISVALIEGSALGGGAELTTSCDFRVMTESAKIGFIQIKLGVITGFSGGTRLTRLLGRRIALDLMCSGRIIGCKHAKEIGLADVILPGNENALDKTDAWLIKTYCFANPELIQRVKRVTLVASELDIDSALDQERILFSQVWGGTAHQYSLETKLKHK